MELPFVGDTINSFISGFQSIVATIFALMLCFGLIAIVVIYIADVTQTRQAIRPIIPVGRKRICSRNSAGLVPGK